MSVEHEMYGYGWVKCARCTVSDSIQRRRYDEGSKKYLCRDVAQCDAWRAELGILAPNAKALEQLKIRGVADLELT